jgi:hypothetical protein
MDHRNRGFSLQTRKLASDLHSELIGWLDYEATECVLRMDLNHCLRSIKQPKVKEQTQRRATASLEALKDKPYILRCVEDFGEPLYLEVVDLLKKILASEACGYHYTAEEREQIKKKKENNMSNALLTQLPTVCLETAWVEANRGQPKRYQVSRSDVHMRAIALAADGFLKIDQIKKGRKNEKSKKDISAA